MKTAYSYLRLSSQQQLDGDGFRRQLEATQQAALQHNWILSEQTFQDLGVSAFKGTNAATGAFRQFLDLVEEGKVQKGSVLIVENPDRISREQPLKSVSLLITLLESGVEIYTLSDNRHYKASTNEDMINLMTWVTAAQRGHEESLIKSKRVKAAKEQAHKEARESGKIITKHCPQWMRVVEEGGQKRFELIPDRVETIKLIFRLRVEGYGIKALMTYLNENNIPTFNNKAKFWREQTVKSWLRSPKVLGHFQPLMSTRGEDGIYRSVPKGDLILNYYPAVIDEETYMRVQGTFKENVKGRVSTEGKNLFRGIFRCQCGSAMHVSAHRHQQVTKKHGLRKRVYYRLKCNTLQTGVCDNKVVDYDRLESILLIALENLDWSTVVDGKRRDHERQVTELKDRLITVSDLIEHTQSQLDNVINLAASMSSNEHLRKRIEDLTETHAKATKEQEDIAGKLSVLMVRTDNTDEIVSKVGETFKKLKTALKDDEPTRLKVNQILRRELKEVVIGTTEDDGLDITCTSKAGDVVCTIKADKKFTECLTEYAGGEVVAFGIVKGRAN